jgi:hypothetical protein
MIELSDVKVRVQYRLRQFFRRVPFTDQLDETWSTKPATCKGNILTGGAGLPIFDGLGACITGADAGR